MSSQNMNPPPPHYRLPNFVNPGGAPPNQPNSSFFPIPPPHPQNAMSSRGETTASSNNVPSVNTNETQQPLGMSQSYRPPVQFPYTSNTVTQPVHSQQQSQQQSVSTDLRKLAQLFATVGNQVNNQGSGVVVTQPENGQQNRSQGNNAISTFSTVVNSGNTTNSGVVVNQPPARMAFFIEQPTNPFELVESDLRKIFGIFSPIKDLRILTDRAAAEIVLSSSQAINDSRRELNGLFLSGVGTLRCIQLLPNQTVEQVMPLPRNLSECLQVASPNQQILQKLKVDNSQQPIISNSSKSDLGNINIGTEDSDSNRGSMNYGNDEAARHVDPSNVTMGGRPVFGRQVCRLEMIDLFEYDPEFDVTKLILGANNSNINYIMEQADHKVDISIKGKALNSASIAERLHMTVASDDAHACQKAVGMCEDLLQSVCEQFINFCVDKRLPIPKTAGFRRHEYDEGPDGNLIYRGVKERPKKWLENVRTTPPYGKSHSPNYMRCNNNRDRCRDLSTRGPNASRINGRGRGVDNWSERDGGRRGGGIHRSDGMSKARGRGNRGRRNE